MPEIQTIATLLSQPQSSGSEFLTAEEQRRILAFQQLQKMAGATNMPIYSKGTGMLKVATGALGGFLEGQTERNAQAAQAANSAALMKHFMGDPALSGGQSSTFGGINPVLPPIQTSSVAPSSSGGPDFSGGPDMSGGSSVSSAPMPVAETPPMPPVADSSQQDAILAQAQQAGLMPIGPPTDTFAPPQFQHVADAPRIVDIPPPPAVGQPAMQNGIVDADALNPLDAAVATPAEKYQAAIDQPMPSPGPAGGQGALAPTTLPGDIDRGIIYNQSLPRGISEGTTVLPNAAVKPVPIGPDGSLPPRPPDGEIAPMRPPFNLQEVSPRSEDAPPRPPADIPNTGDLGALSAKYESGGNIASTHKDNIGWAYGKWQFNSEGNLPEFLSRHQEYGKSFAGLTPGTHAFNERWKMIARNDPQGFEAAQREHATHELEKPGGPMQTASQLGFRTDNRGVYEAIWSGTQQHGGIKKVLAAAAQTPGFANLPVEDQLKAYYAARTQYVHTQEARGVPGLGNEANRYRSELRDATQYARADSVGPSAGAGAAPTATQTATGSPQPQAGPSPQVLAQSLQNPTQAPTMSRERLAETLRLATDPRTPKAMQAALMGEITRQTTQPTPMNINGLLVDPRNPQRVIADYRQPQRSQIDTGTEVIQFENGKEVSRIPKTRDPLDTESKQLDLQAKRRALEKPNIEIMKDDNGRFIQFDKNKTGPGVDVTPPAAPGQPSQATVTGPDGRQIPIPAGVNPKKFRDEVTSAVADAATGKKNEVQSKSEKFGNKMELAERNLQPIEAEGLEAGARALDKLPLVGGSAATNYFQNEKHQKYTQAKNNFLTALLRDESGAVIGSEEFNRYEKELFPQPGDKPGVIEQKRIARQVAIDGMKKAAGPGYKSPDFGGGNVTASGVKWSVE